MQQTNHWPSKTRSLCMTHAVSNWYIWPHIPQGVKLPYTSIRSLYIFISLANLLYKAAGKLDRYSVTSASQMARVLLKTRKMSVYIIKVDCGRTTRNRCLGLKRTTIHSANKELWVKSFHVCESCRCQCSVDSSYIDHLHVIINILHNISSACLNQVATFQVVQSVLLLELLCAVKSMELLCAVKEDYCK